jgi:hypothetical protein
LSASCSCRFSLWRVYRLPACVTRLNSFHFRLVWWNISSVVQWMTTRLGMHEKHCLPQPYEEFIALGAYRISAPQRRKAIHVLLHRSAPGGGGPTAVPVSWSWARWAPHKQLHLKLIRHVRFLGLELRIDS